MFISFIDAEDNPHSNDASTYALEFRHSLIVCSLAGVLCTALYPNASERHLVYRSL